MRIAVVHNAVGDGDAPDQRDVLVQAEAVSEALKALGHEVSTLACTLDLEGARRELERRRPQVVFNLVESLAGRGRLIHLIPFLLDAMGIPYTGCAAEAVLVTSHKVMAKERMLAAGLSTPEWVGPLPESLGSRNLEPGQAPMTGDWIIKSVWEHASIGLDETSLLHSEEAEVVTRRLRARMASLGGACFAERFIAGREFNLSLLAGPSGPEVLPPAEIVFEGYGSEKPHIVDYEAKWDATSYAYHHTPRNFDFGPSDEDLLGRLKDAASACWRTFGLNGYGRVDFRVDAEGRPWILEINTNPCLSPDAGFAAALEQAGISFERAVDRILADALRHYEIGDRHGPGDGIPTVSFRYDLNARDPERIRQLVDVTGFFHPAEVDVAVELVEERMAKGPESGYHFIMGEYDGRLVGYTCYGPIPCTATSYDLYWIAVHPDFQGRGLGRKLLEEGERLIKAAGGTRVYVDTSQRVQYASTRAFYESCGYRLETVLVDFYGPGDGKAIYSKSSI
jgi:D-alanine-D-alanine ligase